MDPNSAEFGLFKKATRPNGAPSTIIANEANATQRVTDTSCSLIYVNNTFNSYFIIFIYIYANHNALCSILHYDITTILQPIDYTFTCLVHAVLYGYLIYTLCSLCNKHICITSVAYHLYNVCMHIASNCFIYSVVNYILCFLIPLTLLHHIK